MILLYSGGLDSYIAWEYLHRPKTIYFALGHRYQAHELSAIKKTIPDTIVDSTMLNFSNWEREDAFIPYRNAFLVLGAAMYGEPISLVVQKGELDLPDRSRQFLLKMTNLLTQLNDTKYTAVGSPFLTMTKTKMVAWYKKRGFQVSNLLVTRSCYSEGVHPCGACGACFRRWVAFVNNGIYEKMANDILLWKGTQDYIRKMKAGEYDQDRVDETLQALRIRGLNV